ncbi:hypothetical protein C5C86_13580 [Rathayibacter sp. AY1E4]|jgi:cell division inhibitor SulA|uniref:hypothetical protein n=1 Tax=unclassified Rathayibacter TaxID=2609250 RepID=UPI000CE82C24|nr:MULTISPECIES: hypothetical protein [unclassified Rathayibacter]PPF09985.1 hypothetical protein C5B98_14010 [Rathayibacter sp. AY1A5]PPF33085.1 hypothetical protein C5B93_14345 [Rathayibacter sp. AY1A2]PPG37119.1 hypothetical protein C5C30_13975 [Rathayibacter sp. AY2B5]PPH08220.1 hypothetical protein C5C71_13150 [Rathayibacter sp. AY1C1]PPH14431.1 hypothetical protein C5C35_14555 [Rathayibacter sp. AY1F8]
MSAQRNNPILRDLRQTARLLRKPQAQVAANWLRSPGLLDYSPTKSVGITAEQHAHALQIIRRLAGTIDASSARSRQ